MVLHVSTAADRVQIFNFVSVTPMDVLSMAWPLGSDDVDPCDSESKMFNCMICCRTSRESSSSIV
jgi:hypothetical protein